MKHLNRAENISTLSVAGGACMVTPKQFTGHAGVQPLTIFYTCSVRCEPGAKIDDESSFIAPVGRLVSINGSYT